MILVDPAKLAHQLEVVHLSKWSLMRCILLVLSSDDGTQRGNFSLWLGILADLLLLFVLLAVPVGDLKDVLERLRRLDLRVGVLRLFLSLDFQSLFIDEAEALKIAPLFRGRHARLFCQVSQAVKDGQGMRLT